MGLTRRASAAGHHSDGAAGGASRGHTQATYALTERHTVVQEAQEGLVTWRRPANMEASSHPGFRGLWQSQGKVLILFAISLTALLYYVSLPVPVHDVATVTGTISRPSNLHILIPAAQGDLKLCKVLLSASLLGYPSPVIINWHQEFNQADQAEGGTHLAKISGIHDYILSLDETQDDDVMLMVDSNDVWLQLRPQTLLDRYYAMNRKADQRIREDFGAVAEKHNLHQDIVFGSQKRCWPREATDPPCYAVPQSTLPEDIYGPDTDTDSPADTNGETAYQNYRQRFLDSGVSIGSVRALRKLYGQAKELALVDTKSGSDQDIFSHIYGDQSIWRETLRRDAGGKVDVDKANWNTDHIEEVKQKANAREDKNLEFSIGVDFASSIGLNTVFAEDDTEWIQFNDASQLKQVQSDRHIPYDKRRLNNISADITNTVPPFWTFSAEKDLERSTGWDEVALLTDVYTGITPVIIHHNAQQDGLSARQQSWWDKTWFLPHARTLMDAYIYAPVVPVAVSGYNEQSAREFWPYEIWKGGARNGLAKLGSFEGEDWLRFDEMCREENEELFRDGKGPWLLPEAH